MEGLLAAILHRVPAIPIEIEGRGLDQEQHAIDQERGEKDIREIGHQLGIERNQHEEKNAAEERGGGVCRRQKLGELLGELVISLLTGFPRHDFAEPGENRNAEHETSQEQMELCNDPNQVAAPDAGDVAIVPHGGPGVGGQPHRWKAHDSGSDEQRSQHGWRSGDLPNEPLNYSTLVPHGSHPFVAQS